jgi:putative hydrolase of the HAD superfamily
MPIKTIVFDFGNVVAFFDHRLTTGRLAAHTDLPADALHAALFGDRYQHDYEAGRLTTAEFLQHIREAGGVRCADEAIIDAFGRIFWPNPEVCELIPRLKPRYRLLLGSNTCELHHRHFGPQFADTLRHFDALVLSHEVGCRKPDAEFFRHCERLAGCGPQECLFIDDLPANVEGARACGWQGIVYQQEGDLAGQLARLGVL